MRRPTARALAGAACARASLCARQGAAQLRQDEALVPRLQPLECPCSFGQHGGKGMRDRVKSSAGLCRRARPSSGPGSRLCRPYADRTARRLAVHRGELRSSAVGRATDARGARTLAARASARATGTRALRPKLRRSAARARTRREPTRAPAHAGLQTDSRCSRARLRRSRTRACSRCWSTRWRRAVVSTARCPPCRRRGTALRRASRVRFAHRRLLSKNVPSVRSYPSGSRSRRCSWSPSSMI